MTTPDVPRDAAPRLTEDEIREALRITDAAYREDSLAGLEAHYDKLRAIAPRLLAELDAWRNCFICPWCGRGAVDEDGLCVTCGGDCIGFEDGRIAIRIEVHENSPKDDSRAEINRLTKAVSHALSSLGDIASALRRRGADRDRGVAQLALESIETEIKNITAILGGSS